MEPVVLDGSILEGGGQVMRNGVALAVLLGKTVRVINIRARRKKPGLRPQHLTGLQLVRDIAQGTLEGGAIDSSDILLRPGRVVGGTFTADTGTAGSTTLLLQAALPCLLFAPIESSVTLRGGTNADLAPQIDYIVNVFRPMATRLCGIDFSIRVNRRGYFPVGRGEVHVTVRPVERITPFTLTERGTIGITIRVITGNLPKTVATAMLAGATAKLMASPLTATVPVTVDFVEDRASEGRGSAILLWAETSTDCILAGSAVGVHNKDPRLTGGAAADELLSNLAHGGCVDEYLQDQLIIFMALADGPSQMLAGPQSLHTETAIHFARLLTGVEFNVAPVDPANPADQRILISCQGGALRATASK